MDVVMVDAAAVARPGLVLRGLTEVAQIRSLCTWGALLLAAVAALGGLVRGLRRAVRRLRRRKVVIAVGCGVGAGGAGMAGSIVPEPSVDFSDEDDEEERSVRSGFSVTCSDSEEESGAEEDERQARRVGCSLDDDDSEAESGEEEDEGEPRGRRLQRQDSWGFGMGSWDSWFGGGRVVKDWEDSRRGNGFLTGASGIGGSYGGFVPLIRSFCLDSSPALTLGSAGGSDLRLWDSRLRSSVPAAVIAPEGIRKRPAAGTRDAAAAAAGDDKVLYVAGRGGGRAVVDLRNTKAVLRAARDGEAEDTWWDAHAVFVPAAERKAQR